MFEFNGITQKIPQKTKQTPNCRSTNSEYGIYCAEFMKSINPNWMKEKDGATVNGSKNSSGMVSTLWIKFL